MTRYFFFSVLVLAGLLLFININKPFIGQHDWNGVVYGQEAKNFARFGYLPLKFGATLATADTLLEERKFSTHYTPVLPILISFSYRLFGVWEWSTRLVPMMASLASIFLVMLLGKELISPRAGLIAGVLAAVTPMFLYYGKNPVHEVVLLPFALLAFYSYLRWRQDYEGRWWKLLLISAAAAMLIGWPEYYAAGLIAVHGFLTTGKSRGKFLVLPMLMIGLFLMFLLHVSILSPNVENELRRAAAARMDGGGFGMIEFVAKEFRYSINLFTLTLLTLSAVWTINVIFGLIKIILSFLRKQESIQNINIDSGSKSEMTGNIVLLFLGVFGIFHVLLFRNAGWYHEYLLFPFLPFIAISAAGAVENFLGRIKHYSIRAFILGLVFILAAVERMGYARALFQSEYVRDIYGDAVEFAEKKEWRNEKIPIERDVYFIFYADRENI